MSCDLNKEIAWIFTKRSHGIINGKYNSSIVWETEKVAPFFPLKDKNLHLECKLYQSKQTMHAKSNLDHVFT